MKKVQPIRSKVPTKISKREYFASQFFAAVLSKTNFSTQREVHVHMYNSYVYADDMMELSDLKPDEIELYLKI